MVKIDYDQALAQAKKLDQAAAKCGQAIKTLKTSKNNLSSFWKGKAYTAMDGKLNAQISSLTSTQAKLTAAANDIRTVVRDMQATDKNVSGIIRRVSSIVKF